MLIKDIFAKDIERRIDGVVKANQIDNEAVWIELDEFVVTAEVRKHVAMLFSAIKDAVDSPNSPAIAGRTGVWISGFFGSGKSMLLKIASLMIENKPISARGETKRPLDFILPKIGANLGRGVEDACGNGAEVILFNIDAEGDPSKGDAAILDVFCRVFNEHRGRCGDPDVAEFEDGLEHSGKLSKFVGAFEELSGRKWADCSRKYLSYQAKIAQALMVAEGIDEATAKSRAASIKGMGKVSPVWLAQAVADYLAQKGPKSRLMFFVDEIGQFIGQNGRLMLNLQTITEELGVRSQGRAWVLVTAQEDIESIIGTLSKDRANDFSKIQGRFATKLKLSSSNADEVLKQRLLLKNEEGAKSIEAPFKTCGDILRNAVSFHNAGMNFKSIGDLADFTESYPFLPYQFQLVPKSLVAIRKHGVTGQHLAEGERSQLDAFQIAAKAIAYQEVGALVPMYGFYAAIESYLEAAVKKTIDQAGPQRGLNETAVNLLRTLFLIRWVEEVKGNLETLVTLSLTDMDQDRAKLKTQIEESLEKLESETLVSRNGDVYYFLTDEEQTIDKLISNTSLGSGDESRMLGTILFNDILRQSEKHRFVNGTVFDVRRYSDGRPVSNISDAQLEVKVVSPYASEYFDFKEDGKGVLMSAADDCLYVILPNDKTLTDELTKYLQVESYLKTHQSSDLPPETQSIQAARKAQNQERRNRIHNLVAEAFKQARFYAAGNIFQPKSSDPANILKEALDKLVEGTFHSLELLKNLSKNPQLEISVALKSSDVEKQMFEIERSDNREAIAEVQRHVRAQASQGKQIVLGDLIASFTRKPYGWPDNETALILSRLFIAGEIQFESDGSVLEPEDVIDRLSKPGKWKQVLIQRKMSVSGEQLAQARGLAQALFHTAVPGTSEDAFWHIKQAVVEWQCVLAAAKPYADQPNRYPGKQSIQSLSEALSPLAQEKDSYRFLKAFIGLESELKILKPEFDEISGFYPSQRPTWEKVLDAFDEARVNEVAIQEHSPEAADALAKIRDILADPRPYSRIPEANRLSALVIKANHEVIERERAAARAAVEEIQVALDKAIVDLPDEEAQKLQEPLRYVRDKIGQESIVSNLLHVRERATKVYNDSIEAIQKQAKASGIAPSKTIKPIRTIKPLARTLETPEEVDFYLVELKEQIMSVIQQGAKVQVQ